VGNVTYDPTFKNQPVISPAGQVLQQPAGKSAMEQQQQRPLATMTQQEQNYYNSQNAQQYNNNNNYSNQNGRILAQPMDLQPVPNGHPMTGLMMNQRQTMNNGNLSDILFGCKNKI